MGFLRTRHPCSGPAAGAFLLAVSLLGRTARADVVTTTDGKTYEGKVVSQDGDAVVVETTFAGRQSIPKAQVAKVDTTVPPLREQFDFRLAEAKDDVKALNEAADWAKSKGFRKEIDAVWKRIVEVDPKNARAHKALGHVLVGAAWMTPEEKAAADKEAYDAAMRAKGLVPYKGAWVTPEDKAAMEKGMMKDGAEWVTEEEYHQRRGERKVAGKWIRVGEAEGQARTKKVAEATGAPLSYLWGPHLDVIYEIKPEEAQTVLDAGEKAFKAALKYLKPGPQDGLSDLRVEAYLFHRSTPYGRFVEFFAKEQDIASIPNQENWPRQSSKAKSFWWTDPVAVSGHYLFPNPLPVLTSNLLHNLGAILLNRYRGHPNGLVSSWLTEGFSYLLEMEAVGSSASFTVGGGGGGGIDPAVWTDSKQWKTALTALIASGQDKPLQRLAAVAFNQFGYTDLVKTWSVVDYLTRADAAKFKAFVDGTKTRGTAEEDAIKAAYGADFKAIDQRWRSYVQAGFKVP